MYSKENKCEDNLKWQTRNFASSWLSMATAKKFIQIAAEKRHRLFFDLKVHLEKKLRMAELGFNIQNTNTTKGSFWSIRKNIERDREGEWERGRARGQERMWEREGERVRKNMPERERKGERFETTFDLFMLFLKHSKFQLRPNVRVQTKKFTQQKPY